MKITVFDLGVSECRGSKALMFKVKGKRNIFFLWLLLVLDKDNPTLKLRGIVG